MKKVICITLICLLIIAMVPTSVFAASRYEEFHGRLLNGASKSHTFTVNSDAEVQILMGHVANDYYDENGVGYCVTHGAYKLTIININGNIAYTNSGEAPGPTFKLYTSLPKGTYTFTMQENEDPNADPEGFVYFGRTLTYIAKLSWTEADPNTGNSGNSDNTNQTTKPSTSTGADSTADNAPTNNEDVKDESDTGKTLKVDETSNAVLISTQEDINEIKIPIDIFEKAIEDKKQVTFKSDTAVITFDNKSLGAITNASRDTTNVHFNFKSVETSELSEAQKTNLKNIEVAKIISLEVLADGKVISNDFGDGKVRIAIPFTVPEAGNENDYSIVYISNDGEILPLKSNYAEGFMIVDVEHFSEYAIVKTSTLPTTQDINDGPNMLLLGGISTFIVILVVIAIVIYKKKDNVK